MRACELGQSPASERASLARAPTGWPRLVELENPLHTKFHRKIIKNTEKTKRKIRSDWSTRSEEKREREEREREREEEKTLCSYLKYREIETAYYYCLVFIRRKRMEVRKMYLNRAEILCCILMKRQGLEEINFLQNEMKFHL